jgi:hypothetical protein
MECWDAGFCNLAAAYLLRIDDSAHNDDKQEYRCDDLYEFFDQVFHGFAKIKDGLYATSWQ